MLGTERCHIVDPVVKEFLKTHEHLLPLKPKRFMGDSNTYVRAAELYATNFRTYLETTLKSKQCGFMYLWGQRHGIPKKECKRLMSMVNGYTITERLQWMETQPVRRMVAYHRKILKLQDNDVVSEVWWKTNYETVIVYYAMLSNYLVKHGEKAISLAPMARMRAMSIHIDTPVMYGIMKDAELINCNSATFESMRSEQWQSILNFHKYTTERQKRDGFRFTETIQTDGLAICIHYRRPNLPPATGQFIPSPNDRVIGVDPGRVCIFTGVEKLADGSRHVMTLTRGQYHHESGVTKAGQKANKWNLGIQEVLDALSKFSYKGTSMSVFVGYLSTINTHYDTLWAEYLKRRWARNRFTTYSGKQRTMDLFLNSIKKQSKQRIVLAYGDASFGPTGPGERAVPVTRMKRECQKHFNVVPIDEFRTSQIHHWDNVQCGKVKQNGFLSRGLLWCSSTNGNKFVNRDVNAALNMLRCYNTERPLPLQRGTQKMDEPKVAILPDNAHGRFRKKRERHVHDFYGFASAVEIFTEPNL
jgi:hypothetical protein